MKKFKSNRGFKLSYVALALAALSTQQSAMAQVTDTVEVTGSLIKRALKDALPITIMKADEFKDLGYTSLADVMLGLPQSLSLAPSNAGAGVNINLRGLGAQRTLVLLDGQRLANESTSAGFINLSVIPYSSLERVEVLTDGASSLYGSDAIGGVVNFITKKNFQGAQVSGTVNSPVRAGGGKDSRFNITLGKGDLTKDGWNWFATADIRKQERLAMSDRSELVSPAAYTNVGLDPTKNTYTNYAFPANISYKGVTGSTATTYNYNPALAAGCQAPYSSLSADGKSCLVSGAYDTAIYGREDKSFYTKGTLKLDGHTVTVDFLRGQSTLDSVKAPPSTKTSASQPDIAAATVSRATVLGSAFYPLDLKKILTSNPGISSVGVIYSTPIDFANTSDTQVNSRFTLTDKGTIGEWDYKGGFVYGVADRSIVADQGSLDGKALNAGISNGTFNPFSSDLNQFNSISMVGTPIRYARTGHQSLNGVINRELAGLDLGAGPAGLALGTALVRETFEDHKLEGGRTLIPGGNTPTDAQASRNIESVFGELELPVTKKLTLNGAARYDKYSDVGGTFNPKLSFKFTESKDLMFRGAASKGFRAPTLNEFGGYIPTVPNTTTADKYSDPLYCTPAGANKAGVTPPAANIPGSTSAYCALQNMPVKSGANPTLKPETSQTISLGVVGSPVENSLISADVWRVSMENMIAQMNQAVIFQNNLTQYFIRDASGKLLYIDNRFSNVATARTSGVDLHAQYSFKVPDLGTLTPVYDATFVTMHEAQKASGEAWISGLGQFGFLTNAPVSNSPAMAYKYRHNLRMNWVSGNWSSTLSNVYVSSFQDFNDPTKTTVSRRISPYSVFNLSVAYRGFKDTDVILGVNNLADKMPPASNAAGFAGPYVSSVGSPLGRSLIATVTHRF
jgi:iron complex outermembrane receptor protein